MGDDLAGVAGQKGQQVELPGGQLHRRPPQVDAAPGEVDPERADLEDGRLLGHRPPGAMAEGDPEAGLELGHSEGLGDEVVGAGVERLHLAGLGAVGRQDDDRHIGPGPEPAAHLHAVEVRQPEVEDDDVGIVDHRP